jgi:hypothetical protein
MKFILWEKCAGKGKIYMHLAHGRTKKIDL